MARAFNGTSDALARASTAVLPGYAFTLACWARTTNNTLFQDLVAFTSGGLGSGGGVCRLQIRADRCAALVHDAAQVQVYAQSAVGVVNNQWHHFAGVFTSSTLRAAYLDGPGNVGTDVVSGGFPALDRIALGRYDWGGTPSNYMNGEMAEAAVWGVALTADEIAALAKGVSPLLIRPASILCYWPLTGTGANEPDRWRNGYDLTLVGAPAKADHPRLLRPMGPVLLGKATLPTPLPSPLLRRGLAVVGPLQGGADAPSANNGLYLTAATSRVGCVIKAPRSGTLDTFEVRFGPVAQAPVNGLKFSFQNINGNADPDGTADQFRVVAGPGIATNAWMPPGLITSDGTDTGTKRTVVAGEPVACLIQFVNFVAGDDVGIGYLRNGALTSYNQSARQSSDGGTVYTKSDHNLLFVLKYADGYELTVPSYLPAIAFDNTVAFGPATSPDERGLRFAFPFDFELAAVDFYGYLSSNGVYTVKLYSFDNTVLDTITFLGAELRSSGALSTIMVPLSRISPLAANSVHRIAVLAPSGGTFTTCEFEVPTNAHLDAVGGGRECYLTARTAGGPWVDTTNKRPWIRLHFSRVDAVLPSTFVAGGAFTFVA